jgi:CubicO group peptidase (beta-lactamase class C family)
VSTLAAVASVLEGGRREGVAPALAAVVVRRGATVHESCHGEIPAPEPRALAPDDLFDVASLTKVMATTTLAAQLVAEGTLSLDRPVAEDLPGFVQNGKERVTLRHLLAHASGLPRWRAYFERAAKDVEAAAVFLPPPARPPLAELGPAFTRARALVLDAVLAEPLEARPGTRTLYCDPGFIALGLVVETVARAPLAALARDRVFRPLGMRATFFRDALLPDGAGRPGGRAFVPTGWSAARHEHVQGTVNDDNAWALGGAAGHAGLFSTAHDVARLGRAWLEAVRGEEDGIVPAELAREFTRRDATPGSERALGWDLPSAAGSSIGSRLGRGPRGAIGHLGFTGTSLWIDLDAEVVCALLTNHVHPSGSSDRERINAFRRRFHDAVADALGIG